MEAGPLPPSVFHSLVHFAPDAFLVVNREGVIVFANAQSETLFGFTREELIGVSIERLVPERFHASHTNHRAEYWGAPRARPMGSRMALTALRRDGSEFPVEISLAPVYTDGGVYISATVRDVTDQRSLEEERRMLLAEAEIERERDRIAADLHDGVMQTMYGVGLRLSSLLRRASALQEAERTEIEATIRELDEAISDVRRYVQDLHPQEFDGSLVSSLEDLVRTFGLASGISATFECSTESDLDEVRSLEIFLIVREALSNVRRHAKASSVAVGLDQHGSDLVLHVRDDGAGFDLADSAHHGHYGLRNMRSRARGVGAAIEIDSAPGEGTQVTLAIPLEASRSLDPHVHD